MAEEAGNSVIDFLTGWALDWIKEDLNYVFNHRSFIETLGDKNKELGSLLPDVEDLVEDAKLDCAEITEKLKGLLQDIKNKQKTAYALLDGNPNVKTTCWDFVGECNCLYRTNVAKSAEEIANAIIGLITKVDKYNTEVTKRLKPPPLAPTLAIGYKDLDSKEIYLKKLRDALVKDKKLVIGVYGEKNVGKTMLVEKLAVEMELGKHFKHIVIMSVKDMRTKGGVYNIQQQIAERIGFKMSLENVEERKRRVNGVLTRIGENVLIIIDDVDEKFVFNDISIPMPVDKDGCRIVVVAQSLQVFMIAKMTPHFYLEVKPFSTDELRELNLELPYENLDQKKQNIASSSNFIVAIGKSEPQSLSATQSTDPSNSSPNKIIVLDPRILHIGHATEAANWTWVDPQPSTNSWEVIKLVEVWSLGIAGKADKKWFLPNTNYGVYFVYKLLRNAQGFKNNQVDLIVGDSSKKCYLDSSIAISLQKQNLIGERDVPSGRDDGWLEIEMGSFSYNDKDYSDGDQVDFNVTQHDIRFTKSGLLVRGVEIRPLKAA